VPDDDHRHTHGTLRKRLIRVVQSLILAMAGRRKQKAPNELDSRLARALDHPTPNTVTTLVVLVSGGTLEAGHVIGVYLLVPALVFALIGGVANAWLFLIQDSK
jgi:hypothetical protein